ALPHYLPEQVSESRQMSKTKKRVDDDREISVINIRAVSGNKSSSGGSDSSSIASSRSSVFEMKSKPQSGLSKKSSGTLAQVQQSGRTTEDARASSLPAGSMYRHALKANYNSTPTPVTSHKSKLAEVSGQSLVPVNGSSKQLGDQTVWVHVHYVQGDMRKRIVFPPGILVEQARDLCMLRFGVWQEIMKRGATQPTDAQISENAVEMGDDDASVSMKSVTSSESSHSSSGTRDQYGLYWPEHAEWMEAEMPLSRYMLSNGDRLELQNHTAFVSTPQLSSGIRHKASNSSISKPEEKKEVEGEGPVFYMQNKGAAAAWRQCWLELHGTTLACYKRPGRLRMGLRMVSSTRDVPLVVVDLAGGFRLMDQHGRSDQKISTSEQFSGDSSSVLSVSSSAHTLAWSGAYQQLCGTGAPLLIKCDGGKDVHVFCTLNTVDYDYWRRQLRKVQTEYKLPTNITISSGSSSKSGNSCDNGGAMEKHERQWKSLSAVGPSTRASEDTLSVASAATTTLVHRPQGRCSPVCEMAQLEQRFMGIVKVRVGGQQSDGDWDDSSIITDVQEQVLCVVVPDTLFGFKGTYDGPSDEKNMAETASFSIDLRNTRVHTMSESCGNKTVFVICILRTAEEDSDNETEVLLAFDVESCECCTQWTEALHTIGGVSRLPVSISNVSVQEALGIPQHLLRRVHSSVSRLSRANWPMPPTTLPATQSDSGADSEIVCRQRGQSVVSNMSNWMLNMQLGSDNAQTISGNTSLESLSMRFPADTTQQQNHPSRFPWLRRNIFKPNSDHESIR
ncbi:hypothetical protein H4S08_002595, partial [Coemansia sp. RSA 1365]